jgi:hypothetical protein
MGILMAEKSSNRPDCWLSVGSTIESGMLTVSRKACSLWPCLLPLLAVRGSGHACLLTSFLAPAASETQSRSRRFCFISDVSVGDRRVSVVPL